MNYIAFDCHRRYTFARVEDASWSSLLLAQQIKGKAGLHMGLILKTRKPAQKGPQMPEEVLPKIGHPNPVPPPVRKL
ncbi:MAG: hypothetical protein ACTSXC_07720 [Candidatus Freyarchaeota archaeon]